MFPPKPYPNLHLKADVFKDAIKTSGKKRMTVYFDPEYYDVYKNEPAGSGNSSTSFTKKKLNLLATTSNSVATYKINCINVDMQKNATIDIVVKDVSTFNLGTNVSDLEETNLSFTLKSNE